MINQVVEKTFFFNKSGFFLLEKEGIFHPNGFFSKKTKRKRKQGNIRQK